MAWFTPSPTTVRLAMRRIEQFVTALLLLSHLKMNFDATHIVNIIQVVLACGLLQPSDSVRSK